MILTDEQCAELSDIPTEEVKEGIRVTEQELYQLRNELKILEKNPQENRLEIYKRCGKISQRVEFIEKLNFILKYRETK